MLPGLIGRKGLIGKKVCLIQGRRRGPAPLSRSPGLAGPFKRPGGKRAPVAHGHREAGALARARPAREEAAPDPFERIEAIHDRAGTHSALGRLGPAELEGADRPEESSRPKAAQKPSTESGQIQIRRRRVREPRHRRPAGGARRPEAPLPRERPARRRGHRARQQGPEEGAVYCQALADKIGVMISTLSAFRVPTSFSIPEIYQA